VFEEMPTSCFCFFVYVILEAIKANLSQGRDAKPRVDEKDIHGLRGCCQVVVEAQESTDKRIHSIAGLPDYSLVGRFFYLSLTTVPAVCGLGS
jgi:hypothetical protein